MLDKSDKKVCCSNTICWLIYYIAFILQFLAWEIFLKFNSNKNAGM